jgi:hypothetical protein
MRRFSVLVLFSLLPFSAVGDDDSWLTRSGYYRVSYRSELQPIVINRIHAWIFHLEFPDGTPVDGAEISVSGGMPLHNHGLPTEPRMTASIGSGNYRVEGMRFHMNGDWELLLTIDVDGRRDTVVIPLTI